MLPLCALIVVFVLGVASGAAFAVTVTIQNADGPGEGFNDTSAPVVAPGNPGGNLGAQRLFAFQAAANIWGAQLVSNIPIVVSAKMDPQFCNATSATLGSAGTNFIWRDPSFPLANTWYPDALANALAGTDLNASADIVATFNSNLNGNPACLGGRGWYYGTDQNPGTDMDFMSVVLHEIGHGLGFQTFQSSLGVWFNGFADAYGSNMYHNSATPASYLAMSDAQRAAANLGDPNLVWDGPGVKTHANTIITTGADGSGRTRLHGPSPFQGGSSLSHWSPALECAGCGVEHRLMEPFYTGVNHNISLELALLSDIGWTTANPLATAFASFDVTARALGVDIAAAFTSDADRFAVNVYRGEDGARPTVLIHGEDLVNGETFSYTDTQVESGRAYTYQIEVRDHDGSFYSSVRDVTVPSIRASLAQNVPNPFNPNTIIAFTLPAIQEATLTIYDAQGKLVRNLYNGVRRSGPHSIVWDGKDDKGAPVGSGIYFYRLQTGHISESKKMVLLK
jgi:hypothetical protein